MAADFSYTVQVQMVSVSLSSVTCVLREACTCRQVIYAYNLYQINKFDIFVCRCGTFVKGCEGCDHQHSCYRGTELVYKLVLL